MKKQIFIEGMSCGHCVKHVEEALKELAGVEEVKVNLEGKYAIVDLGTNVDDVILQAAVEDAGYDVAAIKNM
ncbi:MAG: heavy-metal-associated domain-containing protein [Bacillota bacterium]